MRKSTAKRGPGRPPTKPRAPAVELKGITDAPKDRNNMLEMSYDEPDAFKAIFAYYKSIGAGAIHIHCHAGGLTMYVRNQARTTRVVTSVAGEQLNWFYCEKPYWMQLNRENVDKIFSTIGPTFYKMIWIVTTDNPSVLKIIFKDGSLGKDCEWAITTSVYTADDELYESKKECLLTPDKMEILYPVQWVFTAKDLKKSISDASGHSDTITFERGSPKAPLVLTYSRPNLAYREIYMDDAKIKFESKLNDLDVFRKTIRVESIKSVSTSIGSDDIRILGRQDGDLLFVTAIGSRALVVRTLVQNV